MPEPTTPEPAETARPPLRPPRPRAVRTGAYDRRGRPKHPGHQARQVRARRDDHRNRALATATRADATDGGAGTATDAATVKPRRRQARGERRIAQLLDAAANVFCTTGYTAASTNAIAREAGVSPGTLYQFFPNKEAIAVELGGRLLQQWRESHGEALAAANLELPLDELLDAVLDPLFAFNYENPAFAVLMHGPDIPGQITQEFDALHAGLLARIEGDHRGLPPRRPAGRPLPHRDHDLRHLQGRPGAGPRPRGRGTAGVRPEIKKVMFRYLDPIVGEAVAAHGARRDTATGVRINTP